MHSIICVIYIDPNHSDHVYENRVTDEQENRPCDTRIKESDAKALQNYCSYEDVVKYFVYDYVITD